MKIVTDCRSGYVLNTAPLGDGGGCALGVDSFREKALVVWESSKCRFSVSV